jgi:hypothetical protein
MSGDFICVTSPSVTGLLAYVFITVIILRFGFLDLVAQRSFSFKLSKVSLLANKNCVAEVIDIFIL